MRLRVWVLLLMRLRVRVESWESITQGEGLVIRLKGEGCVMRLRVRVVVTGQSLHASMVNGPGLTWMGDAAQRGSCER